MIDQPTSTFFGGEFFYFKIGVSSIGLELFLKTESDDLARFRIPTNKTMLNSDSRHQSCFQIIGNQQKWLDAVTPYCSGSKS